MSFLTDGQLLLLILWLVYYTDCFVWLNKHSILFNNWWGAQWLAVVASNNFGTAWGGLAALNPFPPFGSHCINQVFPLSVSPEYVAAYNTQTVAPGGRPAQVGTVLAYEDISNIEIRESDIWIDNKLFCKFRFQALAYITADFIGQLKQATSSERMLLIDSFWIKRLDIMSAAKEFQQISARLYSLRMSCLLMFIYLYIILPLVTNYYGISQLMIPAAGTMFVMAIPVIAKFFLLHHAIYPNLRTDRITHACKMFLCPPVAIRATDYIIEQFGSKYDILSLVVFFLNDQSKEKFLALYLRDLRHPVSIDDDNSLLSDICSWQNSTVLRIADQHLPAIASIIESTLSSPKKQFPDSISYCPRCLVQLSVKDKNCPDCNGVALIAFDEGSALKSEGGDCV